MSIHFPAKARATPRHSEPFTAMLRSTDIRAAKTRMRGVSRSRFECRPIHGGNCSFRHVGVHTRESAKWWLIARALHAEGNSRLSESEFASFTFSHFEINYSKKSVRNSFVSFAKIRKMELTTHSFFRIVMI